MHSINLAAVQHRCVSCSKLVTVSSLKEQKEIQCPICIQRDLDVFYLAKKMEKKDGIISKM